MTTKKIATIDSAGDVVDGTGQKLSTQADVDAKIDASEALAISTFGRLAVGNVFAPDPAAGAAIRVTSPVFPDNTHAAVYLEDNVAGNANSGRLLEIDHRGAGAQAYGLDIHNHLGATAAVVVHQYSGLDSAVQLDNCADEAMVTMRNTQNLTLAPGTQGTGHYLDLFGDTGPVGTPAVSRFGVLTKDLEFVCYNAAKPWTWKTNVGVVAPAGKFIQTEAAHGIEVTRSGTDTTKAGIRVGNSSLGVGVQIDQNSLANGLYIVQSGARAAINVNVQAGAAGVWCVDITGQDYGPRLTTATNGGDTLTVSKNATGAGIGVKVINKGTGRTAEFATAAASVAGINADGEYEHLTAGKGILLRSPDGTRYRLAVANGGAVAAVAA